MNERITKLQQEVKELLAWKQERLIQQIQFNPPVNTTIIMHQNHFEVQPFNVITGNNAVAIEVRRDDKTYYIPAIAQ